MSYKDIQLKAFDEMCDVLFDDNKTPEVHAENLKYIYKSLFNTKELEFDLSKTINGFKLAFENNPAETIKKMLESSDFVAHFGEVFTPDSLIKDMLSKLPRAVWTNPNLKWLDNSCGSGNFLVFIKNKLMKTLKDVIPNDFDREKHIVENMLYGCELQAKNIVLTLQRLNEKFEANIANEDALAFDYWGMKFDVIAGNPPYNQGGGGTQSLYHKFIKKSLGLLNENGYLVYVNPPGWRKPSNDKADFAGMFDLMTKDHQMIYLSIHQDKETFNLKSALRYDWYVIQNKVASTATTISDIDGVKCKVNLKKYSFLPNGQIEFIQKITSSSKKCNLIYNRSNYGSDKKWVSDTETDEFCYKLVSGVNAKGVSYKFSKVNDRGHFGIPKVIFGDSGSKGFTHPVIDINGEYGMTQHAMAIPCKDLEEAEKIASVMRSPKFQQMIADYLIYSQFQVEYLTIAELNHGFWNEF